MILFYEFATNWNLICAKLLLKALSSGVLKMSLKNKAYLCCNRLLCSLVDIHLNKTLSHGDMDSDLHISRKGFYIHLHDIQKGILEIKIPDKT